MDCLGISESQDLSDVREYKDVWFRWFCLWQLTLALRRGGHRCGLAAPSGQARHQRGLDTVTGEGQGERPKLPLSPRPLMGSISSLRVKLYRGIWVWFLSAPSGVDPLMKFSWAWGSKITVDGDCSHEIKRRLLLGRKVMTSLGSIFKSRDITLPTKVRLVKAMVFPVVMYGCESWTVKKAERRRIHAF